MRNFRFSPPHFSFDYLFPISFSFIQWNWVLTRTHNHVRVTSHIESFRACDILSSLLSSAKVYRLFKLSKIVTLFIPSLKDTIVCYTLLWLLQIALACTSSLSAILFNSIGEWFKQWNRQKAHSSVYLCWIIFLVIFRITSIWLACACVLLDVRLGAQYVTYLVFTYL